MITLGIESTAHTLSMGIAKDDKILSNIIDTYSGGNEGLIPRKMADHHTNVFADVLTKALNAAKISIDQIDLIAFSQGPGIGAPLSIGVSAAKYLALKYDKKIIGVNHGYAHVKISEFFCKVKKPLILYISGGNSQILIENRDGFYQVLGETLDIGIGNLFDSFARAIKMEHAHGSALSALAEGGKYVELPYTVKGMNLVFSGLLTAAEKAAQKHSHKDVAYSLMETSFAMTCEVTERALFLTKKKHLVVCGGVAQNRHLQSMLKTMCHEDGIRFGVGPDEYNRDNGAMIAYAGWLQYKKYGQTKLENCVPITNYRIDRMKELLGKF
ncbi:tRNA N6-adenosine threonylcarbamoyltransferase [Candidatus Bilamarchaeum dharawalense]|uniref:N(6)-L-threonylcarbamoyladenine synthase n=1 Tax=Candidatus Bilamarchaeum dharawalense TaxID=2885759 RepID=A0A5E4LTW5_9ARCH|nr:tRNA N6-adenosine threonylcarbamoyltransferase [Candidatus Bilamarchaeum dharawalense]